MAAAEVQQGDPFRLLLFALVLHPIIHKIKDNCNLLLHAILTIIENSEEVVKSLDIIRATSPRLGLHLNIRKMEIFWPSGDGSKLRKGLFSSDIGKSLSGVKLLGGAVSRDKGFIEEVVMKRVVKAVELMHLLPTLRDSQSKLLLLRSCMSIAKLFFGLRTCQPIYMEKKDASFDRVENGD
jgi:hypothetical protein